MYKCRACRVTASEHIKSMDSSFENVPQIADAESITIFECFNICTGIGASATDGLPGHICSSCNDELRITYTFIQKVRDSDSILLKEFNTIKPLEASEFEEINVGDIDVEVKMEKQEPSDSDSADCDDYSDDGSSESESDDLSSQDESGMKTEPEQESIAEKNEKPNKGRPRKPKKEDEPNPKLPVDGVRSKRNEFVKKSMEPVNKQITPKGRVSQKGEFRCTICEKIFKDKGRCTTHIQRVHLHVKDYLCTWCPKMFPTNRRLVEHMRTHTNERPFKCDQCDKSFTANYILGLHKAVHRDETPFMCSVCGRGFKQGSTLRDHMFTHTRIGHECTVCHKHFPRAVDLKHHMYGHTGQRPYKCEICSNAYTKRSVLNTHMKTHAFNNVTCPKCSDQIHSMEEWKEHQARHKQDSIS